MLKRKLALLLVITMVCGMAFAAVDGLTVGAGMVIYDFDAEDVSKDMMLGFFGAYEAELMDEALEIDTEIGFCRFFLEENTNIVDINIDLKYHLELGAASRLSFLLNSYTMLPFHEDLDVTSYLKPGVKLRQTLGFGDLYFQLEVPFNLINHYYLDVYDAFDYVGLDFTLSVFNERKKYYRGKVNEFPDGFGGELKMLKVLNDPSIGSDFTDHVHITPFYAKDVIYAEVEVTIPLIEDGMDTMGMTVTPKIEMDMPVNGLAAWIEFPISQIGADKDLV